MKALQILVVEDDSLIAMLLVETLVEMGHGVSGVEATESGAVAAALRCRPDLIIVDAQLREGDGVSAVDQILSTVFVPHLFISGDIKGILARKPNAVAITKPFREQNSSKRSDAHSTPSITIAKSGASSFRISDGVTRSIQPAVAAFSVAARLLPNSVIDPSTALPVTDRPSRKRISDKTPVVGARTSTVMPSEHNLDQRLGDTDRVPDVLEPSPDRRVCRGYSARDQYFRFHIRRPFAPVFIRRSHLNFPESIWFLICTNRADGDDAGMIPDRH